MNDQELDEMLNVWKAPTPSASLRERLRSRFGSGKDRETIPAVLVRWLTAAAPIVRRSLLAGATVTFGALLLVATQALPKTMKLLSPEVQSPYTVDSEFVRYSSDGSATVDMYSTSYNDQNGKEVIVSRSLPNSVFGTALARTLDATGDLVKPAGIRLASLVNSKVEAAKLIPKVAAECSDENCLLAGFYSLPKSAGSPDVGCADNGAVVDRATILGYQTAAIHVPQGNHRRMTVWMAPTLGCFALRIASEEQQPDGRFRLLSRKQALKVTWKGEKSISGVQMWAPLSVRDFVSGLRSAI